MEVLGHRDELSLRVAVVGFASREALARYHVSVGVGDTLVLADPARVSYRTFGFGRGSLGRVWLDPRVWGRYLSLVARGRRLAAPRQDPLQLGGDVLVRADGRIGWIYRSRGPEDRPSLAEIAAARHASVRVGLERKLERSHGRSAS